MKTSRDDIVERSFPVFLEKGADGATMADLVRASGLSKGAFYYYFPDKMSLFDACVDKFFTSYLPSPAEAPTNAEDYVEALWKGYALALAKAREASGDASAYLRFMLSVLPHRRAALTEAMNAGIARLAAMLLSEGLCADKTAAKSEAERLIALIEGAGMLTAVADDSDLEKRFRRLVAPCLAALRKKG
jgi:AcrR family transcriptional regulator